MSIRRVVIGLTLVFLAVLMIGVAFRSQLSSQGTGQTQTIIAGRNVNMVSGTKLPFGDPWLQRQNEPSIAASTRNPLHLVGGGNDYRTVDVPDGFNLPGIERAASAGDAWVGVYESFDGGESWISTLLPGFPQDGSSEGVGSPLHGYQTACDPIVRAGANGLFYYCGIAFDHDKQKSAIFVARYVDDNNLEKVELTTPANGTPQYSGPIQYIDTHLVAAGSTATSFIDMPNMAVDIPRGSARYGTIYVVYTVFSNTGASTTADKIFLQRSTDGGVTWSTPPIQLSTTREIVQRPTIAVDPTDLRGNTVYVAFRRFSKGNVPDGIEVVKSTNGGMTFTRLPDPAPSFYPFDQGTSPSPQSFRTNSYPTLAIGDLGTVYIAWSQRQGGPGGQARIMISALRKGSYAWTPAQVVDGTYRGIGHQFMPSLAFAAWKLMLAWYDQRDDVALDGSQFVSDTQGPPRHTIDVRAAEGVPGLPPRFLPSVRLSRYLHVLDLDSDGKPIEENGYYRVIQTEYNHINYPLFQQGTVPFHGDYLEVTPSVKILPPAIAFGYWIYNINPLEPTSFHAAWTDNRDVRPPDGNIWGDWVNYNAPTSTQNGWPYGPPPPCGNGSKTGMRNQNIYTARINKGLVMGSPGNTKQLDLTMAGQGGRTFVVFVKDTTGTARTLNLVLLEIGGVNASFDQFKDDNSLKVSLQPYSSASCTVYVDQPTRSLAPVVINAFEGLKLVGYLVLNPDPTNLPLKDPNNPFQDLGNETHDPNMSDPVVWNYDLGTTSDPNAASMLSPRAQNPRAQNDSVVNPRAQNEGVLNPRAQNESIVNNEVANPRAQNTAAPNAALTDVNWTVTNEGNTTSVFTTNIRSQHPEYFTGDNALIAQVLVYRLHRVPVDKDCQLYETHQDELIANISNPRAQNSPVPSSAVSALAATQAADLGAQDITFYLAPGEQAEVILRVWDEDTTVGPTFSPDLVIAEAVAQAVNTTDVAEGGTTPPSAVPPNSAPWNENTPLPAISVTPSLVSFTATVGNNPVDQIMSLQNSGSGILNYALSDNAAWLTVLPASGQAPQDLTLHVDVTGLGVGTYAGVITITAPYATNNPLKVPVTLTIPVVGSAEKLVFTQSPGGGPAGTAWAVQPVVEVQDAAGQRVTSDNSTQVTLIIDNNPGSGELSGTTTVTVSAGRAIFSGLGIDKGGWDYSLQAIAGESGLTTALSNQFDIEGFSGAGGMEWFRRAHTATLLPGGKVLIAGGHDGESVLSSAEIYNPADGTFTPTAGGLNVARYDHTATLMSDGTVLIAGGLNADNVATSSAEIYNPSSNSFTATGVMMVARHRQTATLLLNGKVLIAGGFNGETTENSAELYDPGSQSFSYTTGSMNVARSGHTATLLSDGKVLIAGGSNGETTENSAEIYDPATQSFTTTSNMTEPRVYHITARLAGGTVLVTGGNTGTEYTSSADIFNPANSIPFSGTTPMNSARAYHTATLLLGGSVLIVGGAQKTGFYSSAEAYDPVNGNFTIKGNMFSKRGYHAATLLSDGRVLITGGYNEDVGTLGSAEVFWPKR